MKNIFLRNSIKKRFLLPFFWRGLVGGFLCCIPAMLAAQGGATVSNLAVNAGTVTFNVNWNKNTAQAMWSDTVWVFMDYNKAGATERLLLLPGATLTATSAPGVGKVIPEPGNNQGVWVVGNARTQGTFSATVKLLTAVKGVGGACAYASNYPPVGDYTVAKQISFTGTPPYNVVLKDNGGSITTQAVSSPYTVPDGYTVQSFVDWTGSPGIIIKCLPPAIFDLKASATAYCPGASVTFSLSNTASGQTYRLYKDNVAVMDELTGTGNAATFTGVFAGAGVYTAQVEATDENCAAVMNGTHTVTVNPVATNLSLTASPAAICSGKSVMLTASADDGAHYSINGTAWQTANTFNVSPAYDTSYALYVKTTAGCSASVANAAAVTVSPLPGALTISVSASTICQHEDLRFWVTKPVAGATYTWTASAGTASGSSYIFNTAVAGAKTAAVNVKITAEGVACQSVNATKTANVQALPDVPAVSVSASTVCQHADLRFGVTAPVAGATYTWTASVGTASGSSYTFDTAADGAKTATVNAKVLAGGITCQSANVATKTATVQALPATPAITASAGTVCQNVPIHFWVTSPVAGATYTWTASAGTASGSSYIFNTPAGAKTATVNARVLAGGVACHSENAAAATATEVLCWIIDPRDGKKYHTVIMPDGNTWFAQNLNYTVDLKYNNTSKIANGAAYTSVSNGVPAIGSYWCPPADKAVNSGDATTCNTYGALYTWETTMMIDGKYADEAKTGSAWDEKWVSPNYFNPGVAIKNEPKANRNNARGGTSVKGGGRGICPPGWHVPTDFEWANLLDKVEGSTAYTDNSKTGVWLGSVTGKILKSAATYTGSDPGNGSWKDHANRSTDYLSFSAEPAGDRELHGSDFVDRGIAVYYWTSAVCNSSRGWRWRFDYNQAGANINNSERSYGFSVRCVKD
jgi:uncharacterized protein (TIGR02145 family)